MVSCFWAYGKDPTALQAQLDIVFLILVFIPEIGWYIYGNTFVYSLPCQVEMSLGSVSSAEFYMLWVSSLVFIVIGYLHMALFVVILVSYICAYCVYKRQLKKEDGYKT